MMGRRMSEQGQLFYAFDLDAVVPEDHQVRRIAAVLDLSTLRTELAPHYSHTGRPSIDPELMIRMLLIGYHQGQRCCTTASEGRTQDCTRPKRKKHRINPCNAGAIHTGRGADFNWASLTQRRRPL